MDMTEGSLGGIAPLAIHCVKKHSRNRRLTHLSVDQKSHRTVTDKSDYLKQEIFIEKAGIMSMYTGFSACR